MPLLRSSIAPVRPLSAEMFGELVAAVCWNATTTQGPAHMVSEMYNALPVFLNHPQLVIWFTPDQAFACLRMETAEGERWGLPFGTVVGSEAEALAQAHAFLATPTVRRLDPLSLQELKAGLPAHWNIWCKAHAWGNYASPLGIGLHFQKLTVAPLDEEAVIRTFAQYSCHPYFGKRVVSDLNRVGERVTTVTALFARTLDDLARACKAVGVGVALTWPRPGHGSSELPDGVDASYGVYR